MTEIWKRYGKVKERRQQARQKTEDRRQKTSNENHHQFFFPSNLKVVHSNVKFFSQEKLSGKFEIHGEDWLIQNCRKSFHAYLSLTYRLPIGYLSLYRNYKTWGLLFNPIYLLVDHCVDPLISL